MRKDVRAGVAIGGILIAVLIVYAVVVSKNHNTGKKTDAVTIDTSKGSPTGDSAGPAPTPDSAQPAIGDHADPAATPDSSGPASPAIAPAVPARPENRSTPAPRRRFQARDQLGRSCLPPTMSMACCPSAPAPPNPPSMAPPSIQPRPAASRPRPNRAARTVLADPPAPGAATAGTSPRTDNPLDAIVDPAPTRSAAGKTYTVKEGDTFLSIAKSVYGEGRFYKQLMKANPQIEPSHMRPGMTLALPDKSKFKHAAAGSAVASSSSSSSTDHHPAAKPAAPVNSTTEYRVQSSDSLYRISMKLYHSANKVDAIYQLNKAAIGADPARLKLNMVLKLPEPPATASVE